MSSKKDSSAKNASASDKKTKKPLTDEQKAQAKANREQVVWSQSNVDITAAEHSRMITKNRSLVISLREKNYTSLQIQEELAKRHPSPHHEPLTCEDFIIQDFILKTINSHTNAVKRSNDGKKKKADKGSGEDTAKDAKDNDSSDDDVHAKKDDDAQSKKKTKHEAAEAPKKSRTRSGVTN